MSDPRFVPSTSPRLAEREGRSRPRGLRRESALSTSVLPAVAYAPQPESEYSSSVKSRSACGEQELTRGHHVVQHRAVLSAVQGSARCAAHAHSPRVACGP